MALLLTSGVVVIAAADTTNAAETGTVTATPATGSITTKPMLQSVTVSEACPEGFQAKAAVGVVKRGATAASWMAMNITQNAPYDQAGFTVPVPTTGTAKSLAEVLQEATPSGDYEMRVLCQPATGAPDLTKYFSLYIEVTGDTWRVKEPVAPAVETTTTLAVSPAQQVRIGGKYTLTATVTPSDAAGIVSFKVGGVSQGAPVPVVGGAATLELTAAAPVKLSELNAVFAATDATKFHGSQSENVGYAFVDAPSVRARDESGDTVEPNATLEAGQKIKLVIKGYQPGETVGAALSGSQAPLADGTADAAGVLNDYEFTVPAGAADGPATLSFTGAKGGTKVDFAFTVGDAPSDDPSDDPSDEPSGDPSDDPSATSGADSGGTDAGGADSGGTDSGGTADGGGSGGGSGGGEENTGPLASTGGMALGLGIGAALLIAVGAVVVVQARRSGRLLTFGPPAGD
ncbi:hypothetical protein OHA27_21570 [Streptomyces sp. NBC_01619]|uniref:hypothetical protein n=1 Tax=Streptomyces sp. NBC_01619 TaxID=2975901 RepID=UPI00225108C5|nr:hypothetical protein [Streptomyces sp. NBC_01619]MCX4512847.1 hypothetical protein [Streptomyces sp. NBC_01619]